MRADSSTDKIPGPTKASILMVLLGDQVSSELFKYLSEEEIEQIGSEISRLQTITPEVASRVLSEFHHLCLAKEYVARGGIEYAKRLLVKALGPDEARRLIDRMVRTLQPETSGFGSLQKADPHQLARLIINEHPQTVAVIIAHLNPSQAADLLSTLPPKVRSEVLVRVAKLEQISPDVASKIASIIGQKLKSLGDYNHEFSGGVRSVAAILNRLDSSISRSVLDDIEATDKNLAFSIRNLMFTFDDILLLDNMAMREIVQRVDKKVLCMALKGTSDELKAQFFRQMSQRAVQLLKEDMEALGPVRVKDVDKAQQEIIAIIRQLEQEGLITLGGGRDNQYVV